MRLILASLALVLIAGFSGCKKYETVDITGNVAPPDRTIPNVTIETYVNKVYISLLGRKPDSVEYSYGYNLLRQSNLSSVSRTHFLDSVFSHIEYYDHLYNAARTELLNNFDTTQITQYLVMITNLLSDTAYQAAWPDIQREINRIDSLQALSWEYRGGLVSTIEMHRRCVDNYFFDQLNMGSANFVIACFQHFLNRYPTDNELSEGINMVNGVPALLFLQGGLSKNDFEHIFFSSDDYFEGQAVSLYNRFLFRNPNSEEMTSMSIKYKTHLDFKEIQMDILSSNEYIGL